MKRGSRDLSGLRQLFADQHHLSLRAAQWHAQKQTQQWRDFIQTRAASALTSPAPAAPDCAALVHTSTHAGTTGAAIAGPPATGKLPELRTPEEHAECLAWEIHNKTCENSRLARDVVTQAGLAKTSADTLKAYLTAKAARERAEITSRRLVPVHEFADMELELQKIAARLQVADTEIGRRANPANPGQGAEGARDWFLTVFNPMLQALAGTLRAKGTPALAISA